MNLKLVLLIIVEFQRQRCIVICQIQWNMPRAMSLLWREKLVLSIIKNVDRGYTKYSYIMNSSL